jgi:hypothetical protein
MNRRYLIILLTLTIVAASACLALAQSPPSEDSLGQNAALKYWLAFDSLPTSGLNDKDLSNALNMLGPVDDKLAAFLTSCEPALREFRRGAKMPRCVWGFSLEDGTNVLTPQLMKAHHFARIPCLQAHWYFQQGKPAEAIDDLIATMTLGRHISSLSVMGVLLDHAIAEEAMYVAADQLNKLGPAELKRLSQGIEGLPTAMTFSQSLIAEAHIIHETAIKTLSEPGGKEKFLRLYGGDEDPMDKILRRLSQEQLREMEIKLRAVYERLAEIAELPLPEFDNASEELLSDEQLREPARIPATVTVRYVRKIRVGSIDKYVTHWAMFQAAIAVCENGEAALSAERYQDSLVGGPFSYEKTPNGFRLKSKMLRVDGYPFSFEFGHREGK